ncbi:MAG: cell wall hydrolase [Lachnospiraceae bacterium]|nr:cell wall hydrolase [Lachnospiraceae bacterium]
MKSKFRLILTFIVIAAVCLNAAPYMAQASPEETKEKIEAAEKEKQETEQRIEDTNEDLDAANAKQLSLKQDLNALNSDLETISAHLDDLENQISVKEQEISDTQAELETARETEKTQYEAMMKRIKFMYEDSETLYLEILFQARNFSELITLSNYVDSLASYDKMKYEEYQQLRIGIEELEARLQSERVDLEVLKEEATLEKANLMAVIENTSTKVSQYGDMIDEYERMIAEEEALLAKQKEDIAALKKQYEEELRLSRLSANSVWRDISEVSFDDGDRYLLANLIYCEAGGEPYEGQVAVGSVVINRVLSPVYPQTVSGVIYQRSQFSPVGSGRLAYALSVNKATQSCYNAADEAMSGFSNVGSCVYFRTPIEGLSGIQIGHHIFY